jgi:hypothetical protein
MSQSYSDPTPTQEQPTSILNEELKCNIVKALSRWSKRIYHLPYSEFRIRRYPSQSGFGKTGITLSCVFRLTWINTFWKWNNDTHASVKDEPKWGPPGIDRPHVETDRPPPAAVDAPLRVCSRRFPNRPRKPHLGRRSRLVGSYGGEAPPQDYISSPPDPRAGIQFILITNASLR